MMKQAYIVVGPESSGTKLVTEILIKQGCWGDAGNDQRIDNIFAAHRKLEVPKAVFRRSFPHGGKWPILPDLLWHFKERGFEIVVIVMMRDMYCIMQSQMTNSTHAFTLAHSFEKIRRAYTTIFRALAAVDRDFLIVSYESLVRRPVETCSWACGMIGMEFDPGKLPDIRDENAKHYEYRRIHHTATAARGDPEKTAGRIPVATD